MEEATAISKGQPESREWEDELRRYMVRYQAGDGPSVEELVHRLSSSLFSYFMTPQLSLSDVEDLVQECWLRIHRSRQTYRATEPLLPWIFAIARHTLLEALVEEMRQGDSETQLYAGLLARKLLVGDEEMMRVFGKEVAEMLGIVAEYQRKRQAA